MFIIKNVSVATRNAVMMAVATRLMMYFSIDYAPQGKFKTPKKPENPTITTF